MSDQRYNIYTPRQRMQITFEGQGKTQQHFKNEVNANNIVRRFTQTGVVDHVASRPVKYGYATSQDFAQVQRSIAAAKSQFESFPDEIRARFDYSSAAYLAALTDETRQAELAEIFSDDPIPEAGVDGDRASEGTTGGQSAPATAGNGAKVTNGGTE